MFAKRALMRIFEPQREEVAGDCILSSFINCKGKVVPVLPPTEHHSMKVYWGVEVGLHPFFDLWTRRR
jgi:hypothetical protein